MRARLAIPALATLLAVAGCSGNANPSGSATTAAPIPTRSLQRCAPPKPTTPDWPKDIPEFIPRPQGAKIEKVTAASGGNVTQVRFSVPISMDESRLFVLEEFPKGGLTLGRGDSEPAELDVQFHRNEGLRGLIRVFATNEVCTTLWLLAVVRDTSAPYDIGYTPPPSSTPLPFG